MTAKTIATAVNKNSLDTLSTLEAPKERRTSWYLKGLPGWRAAELTRSPPETSRNPSLWHAITGPGTDVCCCGAHFGYPTVPMPSSSAFAAVIPEPISNDDFHDDDAAANDRERVPLPSEPVLVIDQCKDPGPGTKHQGPWQQEAGPASSTVDNGPQRSAFIIEAYETFD
ncbi:GM24757 [Drosophila sechellia]|uniref:GM24757 n=1 Tax=Drosophila sechellia TaxID=7238 RepID=B4HED3_DROSE|nr:GM24757 [Drosophila sechellia]